MKIDQFKKRKGYTSFGEHEEFQCPLCGEWHYWKTVRIHIGRKAMWEVKKKKEEKPHYDFYIKNTVEVTKREWIIK